MLVAGALAMTGVPARADEGNGDVIDERGAADDPDADATPAPGPVPADTPAPGAGVPSALSGARAQASTEPKGPVPVPASTGSSGPARSPAPALPSGTQRATVADLAWPETTRSAAARSTTYVWATPARRLRLGRLARGTRIAVDVIAATRPPPSTAATGHHRRLAGGKGCWAWLPVAPAGWVCAAELTPSDAPPAPARRIPPSTTGFGGVAVEDAPGWPFAWTVAMPGATIQVRRAPASDAPRVSNLPRRTLVPVLEQRRGWVRVGDGAWVRAGDVAVARSAPRPVGVGAAERWLDVDLDQQVLVAYEGDRPVFATLVSTGRDGPFHSPLGTFRLAGKQASARMRSPTGAASEWDLHNVPWVMRFKKMFALHGTHWHDAYGMRFSHGCVNLSPRDAGRLYQWTEPVVPEGWADLDVDGDRGTGTVIRLRNRHRPDPPWRDYEGDVLPAPPAKP